MKPNIFSLIFILALGIGADALGRQLIQADHAKVSAVYSPDKTVTTE